MAEDDFSTLREREPDFTGLPTGTRQVGPYLLLNELGRGAMGTVYEAEHANLKRRVALKILPQQLAESPDRYARFQREMEAIGRLEHPNIVLATDAGQIDGIYFIAMQLIRGVDFHKLLQERGKLRCGEASEAIRQVALGLSEINSHGMIHRDIKPSNLLLSSNGEVKILDLGIAALRQNVNAGESLTQTGGFLGTPDYVAPEQIFNERPIDIRADIYSLGCTFYHMLCGQAPFSGPEYSSYPAKLLGHAERDPEPLDPSLSGVPEEVRGIVNRMMAKDPDGRYSDPMELARELESYCDAQSLDLVASSAGECNRVRARVPADPAKLTAVRPLRRSLDSWVLVGSAFVLLVAAGLIYAGMFGFNSDETDADPLEQAQRNSVSSQEKAINELPEVADKLASDIAAASKSTEQVAQNTNAIREESTKLNETVEKIAESNSAVAENTEKIALTLDQMQSQFVEASNRLNEDPQTPSEWFANALQHAKSGNALEARRSYLEFFRFDVNVVDPYASFAGLLRLQEGVAGARETFASLPGDPHLPARRLAEISLHPQSSKRELLKALAEEEPMFGPVHYAISETYVDDFGYNQSLLDRLAKKKAIEDFLSAHENGQVLKFYFDQSKAAEDINRAKSVLEHFVRVTDDVVAAPVSLDFLYGTEYFIIMISFQEGAREVGYRFGETGTFTMFPPPERPYTATGNGDLPLSHAERLEKVPVSSPKSILEIKYEDRNGVPRGPFAFDFDPARLKREFAILQVKGKNGSGRSHNGELVHEEWVSIEGAWRENEPDEIWFTGLLSLGWPAVKSMRYGVNAETPDRDFPVPQVDYGKDTMTQFYKLVNQRVKFVVLQVTFIDGSQSPIYRYENEDD